MAASSQDEKYRAPALEKGLEILEALAGAERPMTGSQIAAALDRSTNELFRMIQVLERKGYIEAAPDGDGFELTNKLFSLGVSRAQMRDLSEAALPVMRRLASAIRQSCHIAVRSGVQIAVVARVEDPSYYGYSVRAGHRRKVIESTSGAVIYAFQPDEVRADWDDQLFKDAPAEARETFLANAEQIRERGLWMRNSDLVPMVVDLSAPILSNGAAVAALTTPYVPKASALSVDETSQHLIAAAQEITAAIR